MKNKLITMLVVISCFFVINSVYSNCGKCDAGAKTSAACDVKMQSLCPIMNSEINKDLYVDYEGKRIYVCCPGCIDTVKADPAKYVKLIEDKGEKLEEISK